MLINDALQREVENLRKQRNVVVAGAITGAASGTLIASVLAGAKSGASAGSVAGPFGAVVVAGSCFMVVLLLCSLLEKNVILY